MKGATSLGALERALDELVDPSVGIVRRLYEVARDPGSPDFFHFAARAANTAAMGFPENFGNTGGASTDKKIAIAKAVGEAVERYCAAIYDENSLRLAAAEDLDVPHAAPELFALHSPAQYSSPGFPWAPFDREAPIRWTVGYDIGAQRHCLVPAAFTWIPYRFRQDLGDTPIGQPISTGLACHESWDRAALGGLCEAIERDAFTIFWQARLSPPRLRVETLSDRNYDLVRRFQRTGDDVRLLDLTTDIGICVVLAVLIGQTPNRPAYVFAASADLDPEEAVRKALEELAHTRRYSAQCLIHMPSPSPDDDYQEIEHQAHHLRLAADRSMTAAYDFAFASPRRLDFQDLEGASLPPAAALERVVAKLAAVGVSAIVADLTSPDIRRLGLTVVRALAPGLHPLFMGHRLRALGGDRLYSTPPKLGGNGFARGEPGNPLPHPYP